MVVEGYKVAGFEEGVDTVGISRGSWGCFADHVRVLNGLSRRSAMPPKFFSGEQVERREHQRFFTGAVNTRQKNVSIEDNGTGLTVSRSHDAPGKVLLIRPFQRRALAAGKRTGAVPAELLPVGKGEGRWGAKSAQKGAAAERLSEMILWH